MQFYCTFHLFKLATHCNSLQHTTTYYNTLQHTATHCHTLQQTETHCIARSLILPRDLCSELSPLATLSQSNTLQHSVKHRNTLQHTEAHYNNLAQLWLILILLLKKYCNTLQHTATHCNTPFATGTASSFFSCILSCDASPCYNASLPHQALQHTAI